MNCKSFILLLAIMLLPIFAAQPQFTMPHPFQSILVLDEGRVKPLDSYARSLLLQISQKSSMGELDASTYLAKMLFSPETTLSDTLFRIHNLDLLAALGLEKQHRFRYTYRQIEPNLKSLHTLARQAADLESDKRSAVEREALRLWSNIATYRAIISYFDFAVKTSDFGITDSASQRVLQLQSQNSFIDAMHAIALVADMLDDVQNKPSESWSTLERDIFTLSSNLFRYVQNRRSDVFSFIPSSSSLDSTWYTVWDILKDGSLRTPRNMGYVTDAISLYRAWDANDPEAFAAASESINSRSRALLSEYAHYKTGFELQYNRLNPFITAEIFYGLAFICALLSLVGFGKVLRIVTWILLASAMVPHIWGIVLRSIITSRPPITGLFDTFLFVSATGVIICLLIEWIHKNGIGFISASLTGLVLLLISNKYAADGDTLKVLVAVLDSNFWLSTHVTTITLGYTGCIVSGVIGHLYLIQRLIPSIKKETLKATFGATYAILAFGLLFSFIGTVLGGIWADQSWGRFWGWDPKENGALLIVLWSAILFHARMTNWIGRIGFCAGSALGIIVVMLAWFGINILGVGLHSYGFTDGAAQWLILYILAQIVIVAGLVMALKRKGRMTP